jgi:hypothetical protein
MTCRHDHDRRELTLPYRQQSECYDEYVPRLKYGRSTVQVCMYVCMYAQFMIRMSVYGTLGRRLRMHTCEDQQYQFATTCTVDKTPVRPFGVQFSAFLALHSSHLTLAYIIK